MITGRARTYVRTRAAREMSYVVVAERVTRPDYDTDSLAGIPGTRETLFESSARIWEITGGTSINIGESDLDIQSVQISMPWDTELLKKNDEIRVVEAPLDSVMVGKRYQVQSSAKAGDLRATRRYSVMAVN